MRGETKQLKIKIKTLNLNKTGPELTDLLKMKIMATDAIGAIISNVSPTILTYLLC